MSENNARVAFCNQYCEMVDVPGEPGRIGKEKTLNWRYQEGIYSPDELLPALLFSHGFSNPAEDFWGSLPQVAGREEPYIRRSASISRGTRRRSRAGDRNAVCGVGGYRPCSFKTAEAMGGLSSNVALGSSVQGRFRWEPW